MFSISPAHLPASTRQIKVTCDQNPASVSVQPTPLSTSVDAVVRNGHLGIDTSDDTTPSKTTPAKRFKTIELAEDTDAETEEDEEQEEVVVVPVAKVPKATATVKRAKNAKRPSRIVALFLFLSTSNSINVKETNGTSR